MGTDSVIEVYHGGTEVIEHPLVNAGRLGLDFGQGFYVTVMRDQAVDECLHFKESILC